MHLDAELYARRDGQEVRLGNGDVIPPGDLLMLEASSPEPFHVYVFNQELELGAVLERLDPAPGYAVRMLRLQNR